MFKASLLEPKEQAKLESESLKLMKKLRQNYYKMSRLYKCDSVNVTFYGKS